MTTTNPAKRSLFDRMYASGACVRVVLDPRHADAVVPETFKSNANLALEYGFTLPKPTQDVVTSDRGLSATLSFSNTSAVTFIPWAAVYAIVGSNEERIWEEDVPREVAVAAMEARQAAKQAGRISAQPAPKPRHLRSVD